MCRYCAIYIHIIIYIVYIQWISISKKRLSWNFVNAKLFMRLRCAFWYELAITKIFGDIQWCYENVLPENKEIYKRCWMTAFFFNSFYYTNRHCLILFRFTIHFINHVLKYYTYVLNCDQIKKTKIFTFFIYFLFLVYNVYNNIYSNMLLYIIQIMVSCKNEIYFYSYKMLNFNDLIWKNTWIIIFVLNWVFISFWNFKIFYLIIYIFQSIRF